jgi:hypothetical protein
VRNYPEEIMELYRESERLTSHKRTWARPLVDALHEQCRRLRKKAAREIAKRNGWRLTDRAFFLGALAHEDACERRGSIWRDGRVHGLLDHCLYFRWRAHPHAPAAIISEPYKRTLEEAQQIATDLDLRVHAAPNQEAGLWYPGHTQFYCITHPSTEEVCFLEAQQ